MKPDLYESTATIAIRLDTRRLLKNGKYPSKLDVYFMGEKKRYRTRLSFTCEEWLKIGSPYLKDETLKLKRHDIRSIYVKARKTVISLGKHFSFIKFEQEFFGIKAKIDRDRQNVYTAMEEYIAMLRKSERFGTANSYNDSLKSLRSYSPKLTFSDITVPFLEGYEHHMLSEQRSPSTIGIYLRSLRTIVNIARTEKIISDEEYPFGIKHRKKYEIPRSRNAKRALEEADINKIAKYKPESKAESWARDMWLFSFYCNGMNMTDVFNLRYENITGDFINFYRRKTIRTRKNIQSIEIYISTAVRKIIARWESCGNGSDFLFKVLNSNMDAGSRYRASQTAIRKINIIMRNIGLRLNIGLNLTTYVARHSWATLLLRGGVPTAYISKGLGHSSFATTEQYLGDFSEDDKRNASDILFNIAHS